MIEDIEVVGAAFADALAEVRCLHPMPHLSSLHMFGVVSVCQPGPAFQA